RRLAGWLENNRATRCQGGSDLARRHGRREIPGRDQDADADRLMVDDDSVRARRSKAEFAGDSHGFLGVPAEELGSIGNLAARIAQSLAVLDRYQLGER